MSTEYLILRSTTNTEAGQAAWEDITRETASSAQKAIRQAAERLGADAPHNHFVAVPARSWKPVTVKVETKTALKFS